MSSYTPTLSALNTARQELPRTIHRLDAKALLLVEAGTEGSISYLKNAHAEIEVVTEVMQDKVGVCECILSPTPELAMRSLFDASIAHFSCHGQQNRKDALDSGFLLLDGLTLTIAQLMQLKLSKAFFAFLSACETAKGDNVQPDQAIHLAAAMLYVGFRSIVATMWYDS